jgi:CDP-diglyceride synthetase
MGRHPLAPVRKPFCTWRKAIACAIASLVFLLLGFAVREAEANQIGSSDNASIWVFFISGLCLYAALVIGWATFRRQ